MSEERDIKLRETYEAMWDAAVKLQAGYDSISYAAAAVIARAIFEAKIADNTSKEDVLIAIEKYIRDVLDANGAYMQ